MNRDLSISASTTLEQVVMAALQEVFLQEVIDLRRFNLRVHRRDAGEQV